MEVLFWICFGVIAYAYAGYPLLLALFGPFLKFYNRVKQATSNKKISIIISAYNEERHVAWELDNTLSLDYPKDLVEIIVGSDGSTDRSNDIVRSYEKTGVKRCAFPTNRGKTAVQNDCVALAEGEIIVFMDAASPCDAA